MQDAHITHIEKVLRQVQEGATGRFRIFAVQGVPRARGGTGSGQGILWKLAPSLL